MQEARLSNRSNASTTELLQSSEPYDAAQVACVTPLLVHLIVHNTRKHPHPHAHPRTLRHTQPIQQAPWQSQEDTLKQQA